MLATNMFFWDWINAPVPPPSVIEPDALPGKGSGKSKSRSNTEYQVMPDEYWEAKAALIKKPGSPVLPETLEERSQRLHKEMQQAAIEYGQLQNMREEEAFALSKITTTASVEELQALTAYITDLKAQIAELETTNKARIIRAKNLHASLYQ